MRVGIGEAHHRRVEMVEALLHDHGRELGANPQRLDVLVNNEGSVRPFDRLEDGGFVEWLQRTQIDHFDFDALTSELVGGLE